MNLNDKLIKVLAEDFRRTDNILCRIMLIIIRTRFYIHKCPRLSFVKILCLLPTSAAYLFVCKMLFNCDISREAQIGEGLRLVHPYNIIIADGVRLGIGCKLLHEVTIGYARRHGKLGVPSLGDNVEVNTGAKVVGPITVGSDARIGANAVVYADVPEGATVYNIVQISVPSE